jgi:hypothetical protein
MRNARPVTGGNFPAVGAPWILHRGDFDGDTKLDILWRNPSSGQNTIWFVNGTRLSGSTDAPRVIGSDWVLVGLQ